LDIPEAEGGGRVLKKFVFKVKVVPVKVFNDDGLLSEQEFEHVKKTRIYKDLKVLEIKDLGYDSFWRTTHYYELVAVNEGGGLFDCYYGDVINVEKLKGVGAIVVKEGDSEPLMMMKTLVAKWYNKKLVEEEEAYEVCNKLVT
jgi:hypothetical protein